MIRLSEQNPLGTGRHRKCYAHPEDAQRCIKIVYHRGDGGDKEIRRELKYYAHLGRRLKDWSGIPRYHGTVETDCGTGYVYDVIADFDGKPSITLTEFAEQCRYAKWHLNRSQFGIRIDHDLASISDHSLASQSIT
ncbi:YrbL family protein, partial [Escherichia coli]|nr:YrbL family protein [Escherichia coli]